jgi:hypothetical protein
MENEIITERGETLKADRFLNFCGEAKYLASVGEDVYIKSSSSRGNYRLLKGENAGKADAARG